MSVAEIGGVLMRKGQRFGYTYGNFYLPHDVKASVQAFEKVETRLDGFRKLFPNNRLVVVPRVHDVAKSWVLPHPPRPNVSRPDGLTR